MSVPSRAALLAEGWLFLIAAAYANEGSPATLPRQFTPKKSLHSSRAEIRPHTAAHEHFNSHRINIQLCESAIFFPFRLPGHILLII